MLSLEGAKKLMSGQIIFCVKHKDPQGRPAPCVVNGKIKTWGKDPSRVRIPVKPGPDGVEYFTENDLDLVFLTKEEAMGHMH